MAYYNADSDTKLNDIIDYTDENCITDDLSIVPLQKDSFAICEICGFVGLRGQFYSRNNKCCSMLCARRNRSSTWKFKFMEGTEHMADKFVLEPLPGLKYWPGLGHEVQAAPEKLPANSYEWNDELFGCDFLAAPVNLFKHAPLHEVCTFEGMKVEVRYTECDNNTEEIEYFWVATVLKVKGYMGLLRYEGCGSDDSKDFWLNLCTKQIRPVGWCASRGKPIIPPQSIADKYTDWKKFLVRQLTGARTLPANFYDKLKESMKCRFSVGSLMEVVDKKRICQVKLATVTEIVAKRMHVKYYDNPDDKDFWCHEDSPLIHPVGWAFKIGHALDAPPSYEQRVAAGRLLPEDTTPDLFTQYPSNEPPLFAAGQMLEAIDPLNLAAICPATVMEILNEGYMMIRIDSYPAQESGADWFCYHQRSPSIFPVGFAQANNIRFLPPPGYTEEDFLWKSYLRKTKATAAPPSVFAARGHVVSHGFVAGMRLECVDLMEPKLVCVATVARVVADLLKVHFDGWGSEYDQWLWAHSTDVYPVGWCRAANHKLEGGTKTNPSRPVAKRIVRPVRRRRRQVKTHQPSNCVEETSQNSDMSEIKSSIVPSSTLETLTTTETKIESEMDVDVKSLKAPLENEKEEKELQSQIETMEPGNDGEMHFKMDDDACNDLKSGLQAPDDCLGDSEQNEILKTPVDPSYEYSQDAPPTSTEMQFNEDDSMDSKVIPRLVNTPVPFDVLNTVEPENWTTADVAKFLTINDCQTYCVNFSHITGAMLMQLTKDEIIELLEMKVGPSLKIFDLITQLKGKLNPNRILSFK